MGSNPSKHGDVYSFRILLLEMFTGKKPTDGMFGGELSLHDLVKNAIPDGDGAFEIVDPVLNLEEEMIISRDQSSRIPSFMRRHKIARVLVS